MPWLLICTLFIVFGLFSMGCTQPRSEEPDTESILAFYAKHGEKKANEIRNREGW